MSVVDFDEHKVTTMTIIMPLLGEIDLAKVFPLLEITRIELKQNRRRTKKYKIPFCGIPGAILSARFEGFVRGIIKSTSTNSFLNAITIDISTEEKNVNIKLSKSKIQMCGATSIELARMAAKYILEHLYAIQEKLEYMASNIEHRNECIEWLKSVSKGQEMLDEEGTPCHELITIKKIEEIPDVIDKEIALFLIKMSADFIKYEDYCCKLDWICGIKSIIQKPLEVIDAVKVMVNFNYDLGFNVSRLALIHKINGLNGFTARFRNTADHNVTIELPYEIPKDMKIIRRKDRVPCHTFLVYRSGLVTQSGPNEELMKPAYKLFNATMNSIRSEISRPGLRKIKYKPSPILRMKMADYYNLYYENIMET